MSHSETERPQKTGRPKKRHALSTRLWHWVNATSVIILFMSGLNISNGHRKLYWGEWGFSPDMAWIHVTRFPGWVTLPGHYSLAVARDWHVLFSLIFMLSLVAFLMIAIINGHFRRDLITRISEWKPSNIWKEIISHLKLEFRQESGSRYNFLQRAAYGSVIFILLPLLVLSGMAISPGMEAAWPWLNDIFFGRQSARSIHFICCFALLAFFIVHIALVLMSGPIRQIRDMIFGGKRDEET